MKRTILLALPVVIVAACGGRHYRVTDPSSGRVYYTRDVDEKRRSGSVEFKDAKTGAKVTLQSSQVEKISEAEYTKALSK